MMENKVSEFFEKIKSTFQEGIIHSSSAQAYPVFELSESTIKQCLSFCYHDSSCCFDFLEGITTEEEVDEKGNSSGFFIHYHLFSTLFSHRINIKFLIKNETKAKSVSSIWLAAGIFEKEITELFGISFEGNPIDREILFKPKKDQFPLRKSFIVKAEDEMVL